MKAYTCQCRSCSLQLVREKSGNFVDGEGDIERTWKVKEFENKWLWQAVFRKCIYSVQEGKGCTLS